MNLEQMIRTKRNRLVKLYYLVDADPKSCRELAAEAGVHPTDAFYELMKLVALGRIAKRNGSYYNDATML